MEWISLENGGNHFNETNEIDQDGMGVNDGRKMAGIEIGPKQKREQKSYLNRLLWRFGVLTYERVGFGPLLSERFDLVDQVLIIQLIGHLFQVIQPRFVRVHSFQLHLLEERRESQGREIKAFKDDLDQSGATGWKTTHFVRFHL